MRVQILQVPYDSGHRGVRMGRGPEHFVEHGLPDKLQAAGHEVEVGVVESALALPAEISTAFALARSLAERVRAARHAGRFPLVLSGNCNSALGTLAGIDPPGAGIVWFDAHGDFNTPETTTGGFLDGMGLATATGRCWTRLAATIPGFTPIPDPHVVLVGARDLDPGERDLLRQSQVTLVPAATIRSDGAGRALGPAFDTLRARVQQVYLHLDLDVLDPQAAVANGYAAPEGLSVAQVEEAIGLLAERLPIAAAAVTAYDPAYDQDGRAFRAGVRLIEAVLATQRG